jgi:Fe-S-cluster containining protein
MSVGRDARTPRSVGVQAKLPLDSSVMTTTDTLASADRSFVSAVDKAMRAAARRAGPHVQCRRGCTPCCIGVFDITALDAVRLARALRRLRRSRPRIAAAMARRAREQWRVVAERFPGDRAFAVLSDNEQARRRLFARFAELPCPVLDPDTGWCLLYRARPLSCRTFGVPVRCGGAALPACRLNFRGAGPAVVAACTVDPDPDDVEGALLERLHRERGFSGDTVIPAALACEARATPGRRVRAGRA